MIAVPRLARIAGLFAVGFAALVAGTGQASAACSLSGSLSVSGVGSTATTTLSISDLTDDISGTTSVTLQSNDGTVLTSTGLSVSQHSITLVLTSEPIPHISGVNGGADHTSGSTAGNSVFPITVNGSNFLPSVTATLHGGNCDTSTTNSVVYSDVISVNIGGTNSSSFATNSDSQITVFVPQGIAGLANIIVSTQHENSGSDGNNRYAYIAGGPSINGIGPNEGLTSIATAVQITGLNFIPGNWHDGTAVTTVSFPCFGSGGTPSNVAMAAGQTASITLNTPICNGAGQGPGAVGVTVTVAGNTSGSSQYLYVGTGTPHVTSITPSAGTVSSTGNTGTILGGTAVTIAGSNFVGAVAVTFGSVPANTFSVDSAGSISTSTPTQSAAGPQIVTVTVDPGGGKPLQTSPETNITFTYILPAPIINSITPNTGSTAGGTSVRIFGQYFTGATAVSIGGTAVTSFTIASDTEIDATTGAHAAGTGLSVQVTTQYGTGSSSSFAGNAALYNYGVPPPTVASVSPNTGPTGGNQTVTISGTFFTGVTGVTFGGVAASGLSAPTCDVNNVCTMTAVTPAHAPGAVNVAVTASVNGTSQTGVGTNVYSYSSSPPTVTAISPATGSTTGGTQVTITGTNFNGTPQVTINNVAASQVTVVNSTTITAVTPAGAGTNVPVVVVGQFGSSTPANIYSYAAPVTPPQAAPTLTSVSPSSGPSQGKTPVTIKGTNLTGATSVTFGGVAATSVVVVDAQTITALTPPGAVGPAVDVVVTTPATSTTTQTATLPGAYTYVNAAPTVTAVLPATGTVLGGTVVTVSGTNFVQSSTSVTFGGIAATNVTFVSSTTLLATTPANATPGAVDVAATTTFGTGTGTKLFTYVTQSAPTVTAISPTSGNTAGGTQVKITGTNFSGATSVTIGGSPATFVTVISATQINATTPAHAAPGAVDVVVTTPAGTGTGTGLFTYVASAPTVTGIAPTNGPIAGGTAVTITGTNFTGATSITIGGVAPTAVTIVSPTSITATTPAHAAGAVNVVVTTPVGTGIGTNLFTYTAPVSVLPTVTSVSPNTGPPGGGTSITITGTNFTSVTAVMFGGTAAPFFSVVSATSITARSPAGTNTVDVTVITATGTSATGAGDQFNYAKVATSLNLTSSPNPSNVGQVVTFTAKVTGSNPTGTVTFTENGQVIGTATLLSGVATFTTSSLHAGNNNVTASYPGDVNNAADPETVVQVVNAVSDSVRLRQMQMAVMPVVTNISGQAISGAIDNAISSGFGGSCQLVSPNGGGFTYCYDGSGGVSTQPSNKLAMDESNMLPEQKQMLEDDFKALGYSDDPPSADPTAIRKATVAPPVPREWLVWIDVRGAGFSNTTVGSDLKGTQVNGTAGITRRFTPDFLVGVLGGYEHFDFTSQAYSGKLNGDGYTAGGYVGLRLTSTVRFDASGAWSSISATDSAGTASGNFTGHRWFAGAGVTGTYAWAATVFEPSARVYMLWEQENAYTDSLGTLQASHTFDTGRGSAGLKVSHDFVTEFGAFAPYVGLYGDYYFSKDDANIAATPGLTSVPLLQGGAARATGGIMVKFGGGAQIDVGGEYSGLAQDTRIWNLKLHGSVPF
jgi:Autotransporter beta-domain/IPT/TIG domain